MTVNPLFPVALIDVQNTQHAVEVGAVAPAGIKIAVNAPFHEIVVASVQFTVTGALGEEVLFSLSPNALGTAFFNDELDAVNNVGYGTAAFTITAVPEPTSIALVLVAGGLIGLRAVRRRTVLNSSE